MLDSVLPLELVDVHYMSRELVQIDSIEFEPCQCTRNEANPWLRVDRFRCDEQRRSAGLTKSIRSLQVHAAGVHVVGSRSPGGARAVVDRSGRIRRRVQSAPGHRDGARRGRRRRHRPETQSVRTPEPVRRRSVKRTFQPSKSAFNGCVVRIDECSLQNYFVKSDA